MRRTEGGQGSREKTKNGATYKPSRDAQSRPILPSPQKEPMLSAPWPCTSGLQNFQTLNFCSVSCPVVMLSYIIPRKLIEQMLVGLSFWMRGVLFRTTIPVLGGKGEEIHITPRISQMIKSKVTNKSVHPKVQL